MAINRKFMAFIYSIIDFFILINIESYHIGAIVLL